MKPASQWALLAGTAAILAGCSKDQRPTAVARVDTLHAGLIQVTSDQPTGWADSAHAWKYRVTLTIQPEDGAPGELLEPGSMAVDGWGRIYVADRKPAVIKLFDSTGAFVRLIGREGGGPGEFKIGFIAVRGSHLVVQDPMQSRTSLFDTSGKFIKSWASACCHWMDITIDSADRIYIPSPVIPDSNGKPRGAAHIRYRLDGTLIDTLFVAQRSEGEKLWTFTAGNRNNRSTMMSSVPFSASSVRTYHPFGGFVTGWSGEYRILRSPTGEDTSMIYARSWTPDPIPESMRTHQVEEMVKNAKDMVGEASAREIARLSDIPSTSTAFESLRVDVDGNIWARHLIGSDSVQTTYDVFAPAGSWLGTVTLPLAVPEYGGQFFGRGMIYGVSEAEDGRPRIVRVSRVQ